MQAQNAEKEILLCAWRSIRGKSAHGGSERLDAACKKALELAQNVDCGSQFGQFDPF